MPKIEWVQVLVAFVAGVLLSAVVKSLVGNLRTQASAAL